MKTSNLGTFAALLLAAATPSHSQDEQAPSAAATETKGQKSVEAEAACCSKEKSLKEIGPPPAARVLVKGEFELTDVRTGKKANKDSFDGSYRLVFFGFTRCRVVCPLGLNLMAEITKQLDKPSVDAPELVPLFISIDPNRDSAEKLKEYLGHFDARIVGLHGNDEEVGRAMKSFRIEAPKTEVRSETDYQFDHPALIMLMDRKGEYLKSIPSSGNAQELAEELLEAMIEDQAPKATP